MQGASLSAKEKMAAVRRWESPYHLLVSMLGRMSRKYALASRARACTQEHGRQKGGVRMLGMLAIAVAQRHARLHKLDASAGPASACTVCMQRS